MENNPAAIILVDCESRRIAYANTNALNMIGRTSRCGSRKTVPLVSCALHRKADARFWIWGSAWISRSENSTPRREKHSCPQERDPEFHYKGSPHLLEAFFDMTEQKKMQQAIQQAHAEMNQIFQTASVGMRLIDSDFNILKVNQAFAELSGVMPNKAVGRKCYDVFAGNMCHTADCPLKQVLDGRELAENEVSKTRSDGSVIICNLTATRFEGPDGIVGIVEAFKDITELKRVQNEIQSERDRLHRILFHQFENIGIVNGGFELEYQNELLKQQTGGKNPCLCYEVLRDRMEPCDDCLMQKALATGKDPALRIRHCRWEELPAHLYPVRRQ